MATRSNVLVLLVAAMSTLAVAVTLQAVPVAQGAPRAHAASSSPLDGGNDAGSGRDAGDDIASPLLIPDLQRTWSANLTPAGTDSDWYRVDVPAAFCAVGAVTTQSPGAITLTASADRSSSASRLAQAHKATHLSLAAPAGAAPLLGVEPASLFMQQERTGAAGGGPPTPSRYTFAFTARTYAELDPEGDGEGADAGSTTLTAAPLPSECAAGRLRGAEDTADAYVFEVSDARDMTFSLAGAGGHAVQARVVDPSGATVATLRSGDAAGVWAESPGTWMLVVEPVEPAMASVALPLALGVQTHYVDGDYILGITDGPDPQPCRPACR